MGVGLFIPLPDEMASRFPPLGEEDDSPPHVTFLYVGEIPVGRRTEFLKIVQATFTQFRGPVTATLIGMEYFVNPDKERRVAVDLVQMDKDLSALKWNLRQALLDANFEVVDSFPLIYRPHVTLEYLTGLTEEYKGEVPGGSWSFDEMEIWGFPDIIPRVKLHTTPEGRVASQLWTPRIASPVKIAGLFLDKWGKYIDKKKDSEGNVHYEYGPRQVAKRNKEKAEQVEKLRKGISEVRAKVRKDLSSGSEETKLTALAVALMDETCERIGNDESASEGHFGVTGWKVKHVTFPKGKAVIKYVGKSGVKHEKTVDTGAVVKLLKEYTEGKKPNDKVLQVEDFDLTAEHVNSYLKPFDITAKDIRGFHANDTMRQKLGEARKNGKALPTDPKERKKLLKDEFLKALEETAEVVGHEPATLRSQYLVPGMEDTYLKDGAVPKSFKIASRPIPIDKSLIDAEVRDLIVDLKRELGRRHPQDEPLGQLAPNHAVLQKDLDRFSDALGVEGKNILVPVLRVTSVVSDSPQLLLSGGKGSMGSRPAIVLNLNGRYTTKALRESVEFMARDFRQMLLHEMTHVLDIQQKNRATTREVPRNIDPEKYYNDPHEVRAYMQEFVDKALEMAPKFADHFKGQEFIRYILLTNDTWKDVSPYLTERNKALMLKALYRSLIDGGYLSDADAAFRVATKSDGEREDEAAKDLIKPDPKKKPPRQDLRDHRVDPDRDGDLGGQSAETDPDLTLNFKRVAHKFLVKLGEVSPPPKVVGIKDAPEHKSGDYWQTEEKNWRGINSEGTAKTFDSKDEAKAFATGSGDASEDDEDTGSVLEKATKKVEELQGNHKTLQDKVNILESKYKSIKSDLADVAERFIETSDPKKRAKIEAEVKVLVDSLDPPVTMEEFTEDAYTLSDSTDDLQGMEREIKNAEKARLKAEKAHKGKAPKKEPEPEPETPPTETEPKSEPEPETVDQKEEVQAPHTPEAPEAGTDKGKKAPPPIPPEAKGKKAPAETPTEAPKDTKAPVETPKAPKTKKTKKPKNEIPVTDRAFPYAEKPKGAGANWKYDTVTTPRSKNFRDLIHGVYGDDPEEGKLRRDSAVSNYIDSLEKYEPDDPRRQKLKDQMGDVYLASILAGEDDPKVPGYPPPSKGTLTLIRVLHQNNTNNGQGEEFGNVILTGGTDIINAGTGPSREDLKDLLGDIDDDTLAEIIEHSYSGKGEHPYRKILEVFNGNTLSEEQRHSIRSMFWSSWMDDSGALAAAIRSTIPRKEKVKPEPEAVAAKLVEILKKDTEYQNKQQEYFDKVKKGEVPTDGDNKLLEEERIKAVDRSVESGDYEGHNIARAIVHGVAEGDYEDADDAFSIPTDPELLSD